MDMRRASAIKQLHPRVPVRRITPGAGIVSAHAAAISQRRFVAGGHFAARLGDARSVQCQVGQQFVAFGVLDEAVGNAQPLEVRGVQAGVTGRFDHGAAKAAS